MTDLPFIGADELRRSLPFPRAIAALDAAFSGELPHAPARTHLDVGPGDLLVMPAWGAPGVGVKLVTVNPSNPDRGLPFVQGVFVLFSSEELTPTALIDGAALTALRTAAVSGVATDHLALRDARRLVIFGSGTQARSHFEAMRAVRPIDHVTVVSRTPEHAEVFVATIQEAGVAAAAGVPETVAAADIVCTCTTSTTPLFDGSLLRSGAHVNAVGAYRPDARELDDATIGRARVVVETREAALAEAGEVRQPIDSGIVTEDDLVELSDVVAGNAGRASDEDITVFKSVGVAFEDLVVAAAVVDAMGG